MHKKIFLLLACTVALLSCNDNGKPTSGQPIVLGDASTIVTETDSQYLQDFVADVKPAKQAEEPIKDTAATQPPADTAQPAEPQPQAQTEPQEVPTGKGLTAAFKGLTVFIPNIETKTYNKQNLEKLNGASYELTGGKLNGNQLKITKGTVTKISQRHQTIVVAKNELGTLTLESLNNLSEWEPIKGSGTTYNIKDLSARNLDHANPSAAGIRNAVSKAVKNARLSRNAQNKWIKSLSKVKSVKQKPLTVVLRSVMWKIDGKDASGKAFQKQIRIDIPY
jgi:hypothetical protein